MRASVKSATAKRAPTSISRAASSEVVNPTTASPAAAAHAGKRILEGDGFFRARPGSLERGQVGQRIGLGARQLAAGEVRACVIPVDLAINHIMIDEMSEPVARAFLDGLALCEREDILNLWFAILTDFFRRATGRFGKYDEPARAPALGFQRSALAVIPQSRSPMRRG